MNVAWTLAWRYLSGRPVRALLTTMAVVLGVALVFGLNGVLPAAIESFTRNILATTGNVDLTVTNKAGGYFDPSVADVVESAAGVRSASPVLRRTLMMEKGGPVSSVTIVGVEPTSLGRVRTFPVSEGRFLTSSDTGVVAFGTGLADKLGARVGSTVTFPGAAGKQKFKVVGVLAIPSVPGAEEVFMPMPDAQRLLGAGARINEVDAALDAGASRAQVRASIERKLGSEYSTAGLDSQSSLLSSIKVSQFAFGMFGVFALIMGGFIILNTFRTAIVERRRDIGMLRAVGASSGTILSMFIIEALFQGILGVVLGLGLGYLIAAGSLAALRPIYAQAIGLTIGGPVFTAGTWATAIVLGLLTTLVAAIAPAIGASRVSPMEALRPQAAEVSERSRSPWPWIGVGVAALSVFGLLTKNATIVGTASATFLVGLVLATPLAIQPISDAAGYLIRMIRPAEGEIARANMQRQPGRAAVTASAVLISLAIVVALVGVVVSMFAGFTDYMDKSVGGADFVVIPAGLILSGGTVAADQSMIERVKQTPGISAVSTLRVGQARIGSTQVQAIGIDPETYPQVASFEFSEGGKQADIGRLAGERTAIVNGIFAAQHAVHAGQILTLDTPTGRHDYTVLTIGTDYLNAKLASVYVSQDTLAKDFGIDTDIMLLANAGPGASIAATRQRLARVINDYPQFALYDTESFKAAQQATFDQTLVVFYLLGGVLALPSLLALLNTLVISVLARTREIGMLRAVGSTRRQIRRMVLVESLLLAAVGVAFGVVGGIVLGYALVEAMNAVGFPMPYFFPWGGIVTAIIVGLGAAALAAILPARQASRLDIVDALHFE